MCSIFDSIDFGRHRPQMTSHAPPRREPYDINTIESETPPLTVVHTHIYPNRTSSATKESNNDEDSAVSSANCMLLLHRWHIHIITASFQSSIGPPNHSVHDVTTAATKRTQLQCRDFVAATTDNDNINHWLQSQACKCKVCIATHVPPSALTRKQ